jgi:hypothetical protein
VKNGCGHIKPASGCSLARRGSFATSLIFRKFSEFHGVRLVIDREAEASMQVLLHVGLDVLVHGAVDGFLGGDTLGRGAGLGLLLGEELPGALVTLSARLACEEGIVDLGGINTVEGHTGGCGDGVNLVDALKRDTVDLVGSGDEEEA